ncbi:hypothetical protein AB833_25590 [Chromatiales bacterium (ex Bugula neritina AB1)]|nr:hypothetical protein AB833_25590 [Chromatiales bacterium (ex Bugula neritina AB1)]
MSKMTTKPGLLLITGLFLALTVSGCINTPLPDYYVLTPERAEIPLQPGSSVYQEKLANLAVGIGPITIPETLNRPNIVTPLDSNQLEVAEYHRWSEPLRENLSRVVITNIAGRLGINKLYAYPWLGSQIDLQVRIDVLQMIGSIETDVFLQVRWQLLSGDKKPKLIDTRITEYRQPVRESSYSSMVAAYSQVVAEFSDDVAGLIGSQSTELSLHDAISYKKLARLD